MSSSSATRQLKGKVRRKVPLAWIGVVLSMACVAALFAVRWTTAGQQLKAERQIEQLNTQIADTGKHLALAHDDLEALFGEFVGNLDHKRISLDRSARIVLRRGQAICNRIATQSSSPTKRASAYCTLGHIHYHLHDLKASVEAYRAAIASISGLATGESLLIRAYATNHLVQSLATLGYEEQALMLSQQIRMAIESSTPSSFALLDELSFALRNQTILLASEKTLAEAIPSARANIELLDALVSANQTDSTLLERQVDAKYLLAGLLWRQGSSRPEALSLLRDVSELTASLSREARGRLQAGESLGNYTRYKAEAQRAKRELVFAELASTAVDDGGRRQPSFWTRKNLFLGRRSIGTEILLEGVRMPAEFEEQEAFLVRWSGNEWQDAFNVQLMEHLQDQVNLILLVDDFETETEARDVLLEKGLRLEGIRFRQVPANTIWVRDFGPLTVVGSDGFPIWIDYQHLQPDERNGNDLLTERLARLTGTRLIRAPLLLEGGNVLTSGQGVVVCTSQLERENLELGFTERQFRRRLGSMLGCDQVVVLEQLMREGTGHVDWFMTFVSPTDVVMGSYDPAVDPENAAILDRNAKRLRGLQTKAGPLRVIRIPMPPHPTEGFGGTYTNVVFANGTLIVPVWDQATPEMNDQALEVYAKLLPNWTIVPMNCSGMLPYAGAIHCATVNIPRLPAEQPSLP